ncbi:MAG: UvrD-helicase domain-containing protein [Synergistaceae bacterium]|nr:UvrD-helicase domain-containing protein [Synergistota bacterium]NLM70884.1 UvrD-helicase domain-containing protein [Synergistaceae bacterium]
MSADLPVRCETALDESRRELLQKLNPRQREAVSYCEGPLLVLAGAGSGKTRVLAHKIAYLIATERARPWDFLAVTFTNKAANEMKERVRALLGEGVGDMQVSTFHSFGLRFLFRNRSHLQTVGLRDGFAVFDRNDSRSLVRNVLDSLGLDKKQFEPPSVLERISIVKNENRAESPLLEGVYGDIFAAYGKELRRQNAVDFDDLLLLPLLMLTEDPDLRRKEQERLSWVLVDEYQDVNRLQYLLLRRLVGAGERIMVVGDPDQSIYGWRGADMGMILNFEKDFPSAKVVVLDQNYRSSGNILGGANYLIGGNSARRKKNLWTSRGMGEKIHVLLGRSEYDEADFLVREIRRLHDTEGYGFGDVAVLYRINAMSRVYEQKFLEGRLPYRVVRGTAFYERKEVKDVLSFMRAAVNPSDRVSLSRIANIPARGLGKKSLEKVLSFIESFEGENPEELWSAASSSKEISGRAGEGFRQLGGHMLEILRRAEDLNRVLLYILENIGYEAELQKADPEGWEERAENIRELRSIVPTGGSLAEMLAEAALFTDLESMDLADGAAVNLLTLHAAKGLEFPVVFLVGMEESVFPHSKCMDDRESMEEERRLCYVGMTRAEERLYLSGARSRRLFGATLRNGLSRFLWEVPDKFKVVEDRGEEECPYAGFGGNRRRWGW